jgi:hypothetical protein
VGKLRSHDSVSQYVAIGLRYSISSRALPVVDLKQPEVLCSVMTFFWSMAMSSPN